MNYEAPESVKYHGGYDPSDPPQGEHYCSVCSRWDDECECDTEISIFKYEIGQSVFRFGDKVKIVTRRQSSMGKLPTYEIEFYYMGNKIVTSAWQDELSLTK